MLDLFVRWPGVQLWNSTKLKKHKKHPNTSNFHFMQMRFSGHCTSPQRLMISLGFQYVNSCMHGCRHTSSQAKEGAAGS